MPPTEEEWEKAPCCELLRRRRERSGECMESSDDATEMADTGAAPDSCCWPLPPPPPLPWCCDGLEE